MPHRHDYVRGILAVRVFSDGRMSCYGCHTAFKLGRKGKVLYVYCQRIQQRNCVVRRSFRAVPSPVSLVPSSSLRSRFEAGVDMKEQIERQNRTEEDASILVVFEVQRTGGVRMAVLH